MDDETDALAAAGGSAIRAKRERVPCEAIRRPIERTDHSFEGIRFYTESAMH